MKKPRNSRPSTVLVAALFLLAAACGSGSASEQTSAASVTPANTPARSTATGSGGAAAQGEMRPAATETGAPYTPEPAPADPATAPATPGVDHGAPGPGTNADPAFVDSWRIYSEYIFFDAGGSDGSDSSASGTTRLELNADGSWQFGSSAGSWSIEPIAPPDWDRWGVSAYGPERKVVLQGWNGGAEGGPIEESAGNVDFVWVIYHVDSPDPGLIYIKFGH